MKIDGMMCEHCEAHVRQALEKLDGVESAEPSFKTGECRVILSRSLDANILKSAVEAEDYEVLAILNDH